MYHKTYMVGNTIQSAFILSQKNIHYKETDKDNHNHVVILVKKHVTKFTGNKIM